MIIAAAFLSDKEGCAVTIDPAKGYTLEALTLKK